MNCEETRENLVLHRQGPTLNGTKRREFLQHLRACETCQMEYEGLWHTATMLGSLEAPVPPPNLLENIRNQIREQNKRSRTAFFATPISWFFGKMKLKFSPQFVNCAALLCFLFASVFLVKFVFWTETPEPNLGLTAMEAARLRNVRISPSHWASLKHGNKKIDPVQTEGLSIETPREKQVNISPPFAKTESVEMWRTTETANGHFPIATRRSILQQIKSEKLALFWSDIKTNL